MLTKPYKLDNLQTASMRLNDMLHGYFANINSPVTTIDSARAVCEILCDIKKNLVSRGLIDDVSMVYEFEGHAISDYIRKVSKHSSNFAKHADRMFSKLNHFKAESEAFLIGAASVDFITLVDTMEEKGLIQTPDDFKTRKLARVCMQWILDMGIFVQSVQDLPKQERAILIQKELFDSPNAKSQVLKFLQEQDVFTTDPSEHISMERNGPIEFKLDTSHEADLRTIFPERF